MVTQRVRGDPTLSGVHNKGDKIGMGYLTLAFSGAPSVRHCYVIPTFSGIPNKGDKIKIGYLTPPFSAPLKWVELPHKPYVLGVPSKRDKKNRQHHPCYVGGPQVGRI